MKRSACLRRPAITPLWLVDFRTIPFVFERQSPPPHAALVVGVLPGLDLISISGCILLSAGRIDRGCNLLGWRFILKRAAARVADISILTEEIRHKHRSVRYNDAGKRSYLWMNRSSKGPVAHWDASDLHVTYELRSRLA